MMRHKRKLRTELGTVTVEWIDGQGPFGVLLVEWLNMYLGAVACPGADGT